MSRAEVLNFKLANVSTDSAERTFSGHASIFNNVDLGGDVVLRGAFAKSLAAHKAAGTPVPMFYMHDPSRVPGKWLSVAEDAKGLAVTGKLSNTPLGLELHELLKDGSISGLSIGFKIDEESYDKQGNRLLKSVDLWEISIVSLPMNPVARADTSSVKRETDTVVPIREFERYAHQHLHMSNSNSRRFASACWRQYKSLQ